MCVAIPMQVSRIDGQRAVVTCQGVSRETSLMLVADARVGDWVLIHAGYAIQKLDDAEARKRVELFTEMLAQT